MRSSLGPGMGGGGGSGSGGGVIKTVYRAVRTGIGGGGEQPYSHSTSTTTRSSITTNNRNNHPTNNTALLLSSNSNPASPFYVPVAAAPNCAFPADEEFDNWEYVDGSDNESVYGVFDDVDVFGSVPSKDEVQHAVSSLQEYEHLNIF